MSVESFTPSRLRQHLYRVLDRIAETGESVEITRKGKRLRIVRAEPGRLDQLRPHPAYLQTDPEALVHLDWSDDWRP